MGPCIGLNADMIEICQKVEYAMRKYDMSFEMVVAMVKVFHEEWSNADQTLLNGTCQNGHWYETL